MQYMSCWVNLGVHAGSMSKRLTDFPNISLKVTKCKKPPKRMLTTSFRLSTSHNIVNATAKSLQSCPILCDPRDGSPPGSTVPGILQARTLEWVAIFFSNAWKWKVKVKSFSHVRPFLTPWTAAYQVPPSMGVSRQKYWSGVPLPSLNIVKRSV